MPVNMIGPMLILQLSLPDPTQHNAAVQAALDGRARADVLRTAAQQVGTEYSVD